MSDDGKCSGPVLCLMQRGLKLLFDTWVTQGLMQAWIRDSNGIPSKDVRTGRGTILNPGDEKILHIPALRISHADSISRSSLPKGLCRTPGCPAAAAQDSCLF